MYREAIVSVRYRGGKLCKEMPVINTSEEAEQVLRNVFNKDTILWIEEFKILSLDTSNRLWCTTPISKGGISASIVDIRVVATIAANIAAKTAACKAIIAHNHPGGKLVPSKSDIELTHSIK